MGRFPRDLPRTRAIRTFEILGFRVVRTDTHIIMTRDNGDGTETPYEDVMWRLAEWSTAFITLQEQPN